MSDADDRTREFECQIATWRQAGAGDGFVLRWDRCAPPKMAVLAGSWLSSSDGPRGHFHRLPGCLGVLCRPPGEKAQPWPARELVARGLGPDTDKAPSRSALVNLMSPSQILLKTAGPEVTDRPGSNPGSCRQGSALSFFLASCFAQHHFTAIRSMPWQVRAGLMERRIGATSAQTPAAGRRAHVEQIQECVVISETGWQVGGMR